MRDLRDGHHRELPSTPEAPVVDTSELRWFVAGHAPADVVAWFTRNGTTGTFEERRDSYLTDSDADVGVKRRFGRTLELKRRTSPGEPFVLTPALVGVIEGWRRWSPADDRIECTDAASWVDVAKAVVKRRFSPAGVERPVSTRLPLDGGCDVELVAVTVGPFEAWTFALAAFGPEAIRTSALSAAWAALVTESSCPPGFETSFETSCGYPQWLTGLADLADPATTDTATVAG